MNTRPLVHVLIGLILLALLGTGIAAAQSPLPTEALALRTAAIAQTSPLLRTISDSFTTVGYAGFLSNGESATLQGAGFGTARGQVRIGRSPHYAQAAPLIDQTVTAWSDSAVTFTTVGTGLAHGDRRFIFVVASSGAASTGFPVYFQVTTPSIASVTSSTDFVTQNATLTIAGANFGEREDWHPDADKLAFLWDDFNNDNSLLTNGYRNYDPTSNIKPTMTVSTIAPRTLFANDKYYRRTGGDGSDNQLGYLSLFPSASSQWIVYSQWMRRNVTWRNPPLSDSGQQVKVGRIRSSVPSLADPQQQHDVYPAWVADNSPRWAQEFNAPEVVAACMTHQSLPPMSASEWEYWEIILKKSSCPGCDDGEMVWKVNNRVILDWWEAWNVLRPNYDTCQSSGEWDSDNNDFHGEANVGVSFTADVAGGSIDSDDIYFDHSLARVMIGNAATYSASTNFEMQVPLSWSTTTITTQLNRGQYTNVTGKWLYVVDQYGFVNESGFQIGVPPLPASARPAVWRAGAWFLRSSLNDGPADLVFNYGVHNDIPLMCDWDGNGSQTPGVFRNGAWFLRNSNSTGFSDLALSYGLAGDVPVCGDWDGNGDQTVGVVRGNQWYLRNSNTSGLSEIVLLYGASGDKPVVGDWDGSGGDTPGIVRSGVWHLRNSNSSGPGQLIFTYGLASGDRPVVGDWDGDGVDTVGVVRGNAWFLRSSNTAGLADSTFQYGAPADTPLVWR
ncbi:MAG: hypothetical protein KIT87_16435 [Anaerolineae bacterium]|nr:hypothetical protein [Anaerolineae bacterium]